MALVPYFPEKQKPEEEPLEKQEEEGSSQRCIEVVIVPFLIDFKNALKKVEYKGEGVRGRFVSKTKKQIFEGNVIDFTLEMSQEIKREEKREWLYEPSKPALKGRSSSSSTSPTTPESPVPETEEKETTEEEEPKRIKEKTKNKILYGFFSAKETKSKTIDFQNPEMYQTLDDLIQEVKISLLQKKKKKKALKKHNNL